MKRRVRTLGYAFARALASIRRRPLIAALTIGVMTVALVLVGIAHMAERNVRTLSDGWGAGVQMIVYLDEGTSNEHAENISKALIDLPAVHNVIYVPPEKAMEHLRLSLGHHDELLEGIEASFLPASLEVQLVEGVRDLVSAHPVMERLLATSGVEDVEFLGNWVDDFTALIGRVQRAGLYLVIFASLIGVFTVVATMRLSADSRASELRVLSLMGAPGVLRRGPTLIEGALLGLLGAVSATLLLWLLFSAGAPIIASALASSFGSMDLTFLATKDILQLGLFGVSLGVVGGMLTNHSQAPT
ncbi:MAG: hypothetical protein GY811_04455 [Myxococcales bacterium]|nr:hypothetical protein [Myxococcales bacterium]